MSYADRDQYGMYKGTSSHGPGPALMGADTLIGDGVVNGDDDKLGDIKEIMLDMRTGQVAYAVLAFGGFLGLGEKLFAVPWQALHLDTTNHRFVLDVEKERLKHAPGFNKDAWPDMADVDWATQVHTFYGTDPSRRGGPSMGPDAAVRTSTGTTATGAGVASGVGGGAGAGDLGSGSGISTDPRAGTQGGDTDLSHIRGSNIG